MKRILIANGAFSSLVLASILKDNLQDSDKNFFLGYFKNTVVIKEKSLHVFFNYLVKTEKNLNFFDYKTFFRFEFDKLSKDLSCKDIDEIYIPINSRTKKIYKSFKKYYKRTNFIFYEEGLMSYVKPLLDISLRRIMANYESYYIFYDEKLKNLLIKSFPFIKFKTIKKDFIIESIRIIQKILPPLIDLPKNYKYALVLPQYYYQNNKKKTIEIIHMYYESIKQIIDNNYKIIFKDHPKASLKYSNILKPMFNDQDLLLFENIYPNIFISKNEILKRDFPVMEDSLQMIEILPVEVIAEKIKIDLVFSVYSTALFTLKYLFNIPANTSVAMLNNRINIFSLYPTLSALITKNILCGCNSNNKILHTDNKTLKILMLILKLIHKYKE